MFANLLIGLLSRLLRHHDARKLQPVIITFRWLELGGGKFKKVMRAIKEMSPVNVSTIHC